VTTSDASGPTGAARRTGRPIDRSADAEILRSTLELLAERGYERLTLDEVAARTGRAKTTVYRRWPTKEDLVLAAVRSAGRPPEIDELPDLGSLRADLLAVVDSPWLGGSEGRLAVFGGLTSATRTSARLAEAVRSQITEPYVEIYRRLLQRAIRREELPALPASRVLVLADVIPAMSTHRLSAGDGPADRDFFVAVVDDVLLPALRGAG
jgi:AcrR family transcriptional regulator